MDEHRNIFQPLEAYVFVSRTPKSCGAKAEADAKRVTRRRIALIMVKNSIMLRRKESAVTDAPLARVRFRYTVARLSPAAAYCTVDLP